MRCSCERPGEKQEQEQEKAKKKKEKSAKTCCRCVCVLEAHRRRQTQIQAQRLIQSTDSTDLNESGDAERRIYVCIGTATTQTQQHRKREIVGS